MYQDALAYAGCMRNHGDPSFPDPELVNNAHEHGITMGQGVDQSSPQYVSANKTCKHLLPNNGNGPHSGTAAADDGTSPEVLRLDAHSRPPQVS
jgi:hypothetical protein